MRERERQVLQFYASSIGHLTSFSIDPGDRAVLAVSNSISFSWFSEDIDSLTTS